MKEKRIANLRAKIAAAKAELTIRERTRNESARGYRKVEHSLRELQAKLKVLENESEE